jgi:flagella basal body P-ring formation protein FlgA
MINVSKTCRLSSLLIVGALLYIGGIAQAQDVQSLDSIRAAAEAHVRAKMPAQAHGIVVTAGELDSRLRLSQCSQPLKAALPSGAQIQARMAVGVSCKQGTPWTIYVPVTVESEIAVLVLKNAAPRGARLTAADVIAQNQRVSGLPVSYVTDTRALERQTLKRPLAAGAVLTTDSLLPDFIVKRGEQVTLLAAASGIEVRAPGRALADGRDGARIPVQNLASLKVVEGVVDATRIIHVSP